MHGKPPQTQLILKSFNPSEKAACRKDGFPVALYADVIRHISIGTAEFSVAADRDVLLGHVDRLFVSRSAFDRFAKFVALARLGRSCYTRGDRTPFTLLAIEEGFDQLGRLLDADSVFDSRKNPEALRIFDETFCPLLTTERLQAVHMHVVEELQAQAAQSLLDSRSTGV